MRGAVLRVLQKITPRATPEIPAFDFGEAHPPVEAPVLAVGNCWLAVRELPGDNLADGSVLGTNEVFARELARSVLEEGLLENVRAQKAADMVAAAAQESFDPHDATMMPLTRFRGDPP